MSVLPALMLKTIQYSRGVIGASESSTTSASDLVCGGIPDQKIGGLSPLPWQVYCGAMAPWTIIGLVTVMVSCSPWPSDEREFPTRPQPLTRQAAPAMTAAIR